MQSPTSKGGGSSALSKDLAVIRGPFAAALREKGYKHSTISTYVAVLCRAARCREREGRKLVEVQRADVPAMLRRLLGRHRDRHYYRTCASPLRAWLRFHGRHAKVDVRYPWQSWLDDYRQFLAEVRGLAAHTSLDYVSVARAFMAWRFGNKPACWSKVHAADLWRYGERCASGKSHQPSYVNRRLSALRQFLSFVQLRGACSAQLRHAVPKVCNYGHAASTATLTDRQRERLLASFNPRSACGQRDHAMALCMIDLGFRAIEVARLRLTDIDWERNEVEVPAAKASRGRRLPLPRLIAAALRTYIEHWRPATDCPQVFMGHRAPRNRPVTTLVIRTAIWRGYRRCGFPAGWCGTHRLRRTFATRLYAHGVDLKQIADLLGHRHLTTATRYAQTDPTGLRAVAQPWPES